MTICFNANELALDGVGPTLVSMIRHAFDSSPLELVFLSSGLAGIHKNNIQHLLEEECFNGRVPFIDFDTQKVKSLQGSYTLRGVNGFVW